MATGYTDDVRTGKLTEFPDFVWRCARAMGALIMMRDEPPGAPIPERFEPNNEWNLRHLSQLETELAEIERWTDAEADKAQEEKLAETAEYRDGYNANKLIEAERYEHMIAEVEAWEPPTDDHDGLKAFMLEQLRDSLRFDCSSYEPRIVPRVSADEFKAQRVAEVRQAIAQTQQSIADEIERTRGRNAWLRALRESVPQPSDVIL